MAEFFGFLFFLLLAGCFGYIGAAIREKMPGTKYKKITDNLENRYQEIGEEFSTLKNRIRRAKDDYDTMLDELKNEVRTASDFYSRQVEAKAIRKVDNIHEGIKKEMKDFSSKTENMVHDKIATTFQIRLNGHKHRGHHQKNL